MPTDPPITDEEAADMRARLALYDAQQRDAALAAQSAAAAARDARMEQVRTLVASERYTDLADEMAAMVDTYAQDGPVGVILKVLAEQMPKLKEWAEK